MADPTGRKARQQMGAGTARTHLENCTGKKLISASIAPEDSSQKAGYETNRKSLDRISIVLGMWFRRNWQDQANKSAGWMPGH